MSAENKKEETIQESESLSQEQVLNFGSFGETNGMRYIKLQNSYVNNHVLSNVLHSVPFWAIVGSLFTLDDLRYEKLNRMAQAKRFFVGSSKYIVFGSFCTGLLHSIMLKDFFTNSEQSQ